MKIMWKNKLLQDCVNPLNIYGTCKYRCVISLSGAARQDSPLILAPLYMKHLFHTKPISWTMWLISISLLFALQVCVCVCGSVNEWMAPPIPDSFGYFKMQTSFLEIHWTIVYPLLSIHISYLEDGDAFGQDACISFISFKPFRRSRSCIFSLKWLFYINCWLYFLWFSFLFLFNTTYFIYISLYYCVHTHYGILSKKKKKSQNLLISRIWPLSRIKFAYIFHK